MIAKIPNEVTRKVLEDLTNARDLDDIVMDVCEKTNLDWKQAELFVNRLSIENEDKITLTQSPLLVLLALFTFLSGVIMVGYALYQFYLAYSTDSRTFLFELLFLGMNGQIIFWSFLLGMAMILGSLKGMHRIWEAIFERFRKDL